MLRVLDLFSGIGGFSLGLERTGGFKTVAFCEIDPFCQKVLRKHWPDVPIYEDVRTLTAERLRADGISVDVICGGFPCQDISIAGRGAGIEGERSGLWSEYARIIGELRPRYVIVENVAALLGRGLDKVLGDLAALGLDAEWHCIPASAVGAPHFRDRVWVVAYADRDDDGRPQIRRSVRGRESSGESQEQGAHRKRHRGRSGDGGQAAHVANTECVEGIKRLDASVQRRRPRETEQVRLGGFALANSDGAQCQRDGRAIRIFEEYPDACSTSWWVTEPDVGRVAHGVPARMDRLASLGNAVVPQIPELIGRAILEAQP